MKVLLADDDPTTLRLVGHALRKMGHSVVTATNGIEASEKFLAEWFPVVVTDWEMPGMNGIEFCRLIRNARLPVYTYIIFLTSRQEKRHLIEALDAGGDDFISKPFDIQEMQVRTRAAERIVRLESELRDVNKDLRSMNERLLYMSRLDPLMEIGNRLDFEEKVAAFHDRAVTQGFPYAIIMCDVDHFKSFNDRYGHQSGDEILRKVAAAVRGTLRGQDAAFRYGGEEILLYLHRQDLSGAAAERVRRSVADQKFPLKESDEPVRVTISCGVAPVSSRRGSGGRHLDFGRRAGRPCPLRGQAPRAQPRCRRRPRLRLRCGIQVSRTHPRFESRHSGARAGCSRRRGMTDYPE